MADSIQGTAILDETDPKYPALHFVCVRENGDRKPFVSSIPIGQAGKPTPDHQGPRWDYEERGTELHCSPSVKMSYQRQFDAQGDPLPKEKWHWVEYFHNEGKWTVRFIRWKPEDGDGGAIFQRMRELNAALLNGTATDLGFKE